MKLNGNLTLNNLGLSEVQNLVIERVTNFPAYATSSDRLAELGRIVFKVGTGENKLYYSTGDVAINNGWNELAVGSGLAQTQNELNNVQTALGALVNGSTGGFDSAALANTNYISSATSLTDALTMLDSSITSHNTFEEMDDVNLTSLSAGQFAQYDGTQWINRSIVLDDLFDATIVGVANKQVVYFDNATSQWVNHTLVLTDISDVTTTAAELNELNTSGALLADFVKLHALTATASEINQLAGSSVSQADLIKLHDITVSAADINNLSGIASNVQTQLDNKQPLDADLTWIAAQTPAADSSETLTINDTTVTHAGQNDFMIGTGGIEGSRWTLKRGADARTSLGLGNIAILDEVNFIRGDVASSNVARDVSWNNYKIVNLAPATDGTDAVNLNQLQAAQAGLDRKVEADVATTANITLSGTQTIDGIAVVAGDIVLVKDQTVAAENGLYTVAAGSWARTADTATAEAINHATTFVKTGDTQAITQWTVSGAVATIDTDAVTWVQTNALAGVTAGIGLSKTGNTINVVLGAGIVELPSDEVGLDLYDPTSSALILSADGSTRSTDTNARLHLLLDLDGNGKLVQSAAGLKVTTNTITEAELTASVAGNGLTGGNGSALAVVSASGTGSTGGDDTANWSGIGTITVTADDVGVTLGSTSTTAAPGNHVHKAAAITFDNTSTSLAGSPASVQAAIEAIDTTLDDVFADLSNVKTAAGLNTTTGEFVAHTTASLASVNAAASMFAVDEALSTAITDLDSQINTKVNTAYAIYTSVAASTTHVVTHNCNQKYCLVTVVDNTTGSATLDQVIIPHSITYNSANQLTVAFNQSIDCVVIVNGLTAARAV